jgi:uncharacterized protein (DUF2147 family)
MRQALAIFATEVLLATSLFAADVTGTWNAKVELGGGQGGSPTFVIKQEGEKLTGTYSGALGDAPLTGSIKGNDVVFNFDAGGCPVHYEGQLDADGKKMQGKVDYCGQASGTFTATKK